MDEALLDHEVPADLLELHEVLEYNGLRAPHDPTRATALGTALRVGTGTALSWDERFVTRSEWGARPEKSHTALDHAEGVTCHWEGPTMGVFPHTSCASKVRGIQAFHMDTRGWSDIAYTAIVCPHGYVFEGRWAGKRTAAQGTNDGNDRSLAVCFLSGSGDPWPESARAGFAEVIFVLRAFKACGNTLWAHRDWHTTQCPGDAITADVRDGDIARRSTPAPTPPKPQVDLSPVGVKAHMLELGRTAPTQDVKRAQVILKAHFGQTIPVTGTYDSATADAVKNVQRFFSLHDDGIVGTDTWRLLMEAPY